MMRCAHTITRTYVRAAATARPCSNSFLAHALPFSTASTGSPVAAASQPATTCTLRPQFDFKRISSAQEHVRANILRRKANGDVDAVVKLYSDYLSVNEQLETLRRERNQASKAGPVDREAGRKLKETVARLTAEAAELKARLDQAAAALPCDTHPDAPIGPEDAARTVYLHGEPRKFEFEHRDHLQIAHGLGILDLSTPSNVCGSGFAMLRGNGVLLEMALISWALSRAAAAGFMPVLPPDLVKSAFVEACGFNPRDANGIASQVYSVANSDLCLIGTSEIPLAAQHANSIMESGSLPATYSAVSHCFRREAGAHGQRDKGLYRLHQFTKVELFAFVNPYADASSEPTHGLRPVRAAWGGRAEDVSGMLIQPSAASEHMLDKLVNLQINMYAELGLHFRVLDMPTEELGASAYRKFDIEAWMPGRTGSAAGSRGAFGEISSASNCVDYQARRLGIRCRVGPNDNRPLHTLNATACAVPRVMLALLETHQQADGSVVIPDALRPFMGGMDVLRPIKQAK